MKTTRLALAVFLVLVGSVSSARAACTPTGFIRDGIDMTAALINPIVVPAVLDATGCNIGIYTSVGVLAVNNADIYGANYFGIVVNGDAANVVVNITNTLVHNIGETPFNGTQHGIGIYLRAFFTSNIIGQVNNNTVFAYQKGGIVANGKGVHLTSINQNRVIGLGHVDFIAQNGIQIGYGAMPYPSQVASNTVVGNSYLGFPGDGSASGGILVVGGPFFGLCPDGADCPYSPLVLMAGNLLYNNDVGVFSSNVAADGSAPPTPTVDLILSNIAGSDFCYNQSYQAGISDQGNTDFILSNYVVQGGGYGPNPCGKGIDITGSVNVQAAGNNVTPTSDPPSSDVARSRALRVVPEKP